MNENLKNKFNTIKNDVKDAWNKQSDTGKDKVQQKDIKRDISGTSDTSKESFRKQGKV